MIYFRNKLPEFLDTKWPYIRDHHLYVGVPRDNDFLTMVALVQEYGAHIQAKNYPFLWIPTANAQGHKPGEIPNLYVRRQKGADHGAAGYDDQDSPNGFCVCFVLKKSINIPARSFISNTVTKHEREWNSLIAKELNLVMLGDLGVSGFFTNIGKYIVNELFTEMIQFSNPSNAPLTAERKGRDDPLVDTGKLAKSLTYQVL